MENVQAGERQKTPLFHHLLMNPIARKLTRFRKGMKPMAPPMEESSENPYSFYC